MRNLHVSLGGRGDSLFSRGDFEVRGLEKRAEGAN